MEAQGKGEGIREGEGEEEEEAQGKGEGIREGGRGKKRRKHKVKGRKRQVASEAPGIKIHK